jgi:Pentapeptide repeats (8 copies)
MASAPTPSPDPWKEAEELRLRRTEVHTQQWTGIAQVVLSVATVATALVALWAALQSQQSLKSATQNNLEQAQDNQLSTALTSLGSNDVTERIAGLTQLELNIADRLTPTSTAAFGTPSAYNYYTTALEIYSGYLQSHGVGSMTTAAGTGGGTRKFGPGYGAPPRGAFSIDTQYAVDEIAKMLDLKNQVHEVSPTVPGFDVANDELYQLNLEGMDFSWVHAYMVGIDLRGAVMEEVHLSALDDVENSHLQCADLKYADLRHADLKDANLSGADLQGADLQHANLTGANLRGAYVSGANFSGAQASQATLTSMHIAPGHPATGLPPGVTTMTGQPRIQPSCLANPSYGDPPTP